MYIYVNEEFVLEKEAKISPFDHGFLYGLGVFETFRIYDGHPFLLDDHFQRLQKSVVELNIEFKLSKEALLEIIQRLLTLNEIKDAYVRFNVSAGAAPVGLQTETYTEPSVIVFIKPITAPFVQTKQAEILKTRRNTPEGKERLKSHHFLNNIIGKRELKSPSNEGIFLTKEGFVAEGIVSNVFWVKDGQVYTPSLKTGILNGITRKFVLEILKLKRIPYFEGFYPLAELLRADEVFVTNSIQEIVMINKVNDHYYLDNKLTAYLQSFYTNSVKHRLTSIQQLHERA